VHRPGEQTSRRDVRGERVGNNQEKEKGSAPSVREVAHCHTGQGAPGYETSRSSWRGNPQPIARYDGRDVSGKPSLFQPWIFSLPGREGQSGIQGDY